MSASECVPRHIRLAVQRFGTGSDHAPLVTTQAEKDEYRNSHSFNRYFDGLSWRTGKASGRRSMIRLEAVSSRIEFAPYDPILDFRREFWKIRQ